MDWINIAITFAATIVPLIISITTIVSQFFSNKDNNNHSLKLNLQNNELQLKLKHLEFYYSEKTPAINNYLECLIKYLNDKSSENFTNYKIAMAKVSAFVSENVYSKISKMDYFLSENFSENFSEAIKQQALDDIIDSLNSEAQQYK